MAEGGSKGTRISAGNRRRVQVRKERPDAFSEAKKQVFLDHLASCCTVATAAAAAGVSVNTVNYHRRTDPVFDQRFVETLNIGYDALDAAMLARAARGGHYVPGPGAAEAPGAETLDTELALHLLSLRRRPMGQRTGRAGREPTRATEKELNEAILALLDVFSRRMKAKREKKKALRRPSASPGTGSSTSPGTGPSASLGTGPSASLGTGPSASLRTGPEQASGQPSPAAGAGPVLPRDEQAG